MTNFSHGIRFGGWRSFAAFTFCRSVVGLVAAASVLVTSVAPAYAVTSSSSAPALAGLPSAPAPGVESSGEGAANVSPYDVNNVGGMGLMSLMSGGDEPKSAKFEPPETPYNGAFSRSFDLEVPPFFELTPALRLGYNSGDNRQHSGDGFSLLGVGWTLSGGGLIERKSTRGLPKFDAADQFELDGNGLMDCDVEGVARETPSCSAGGTHTARYETYERIKKVASDNSWVVTARDGTVSTYRPLAHFAPSGTEDARLRDDYRWLLASVTDTDGNAVTYSYDCAALPTCYVSTISYGVNTIQFYWETRTDSFTHATGISLANVTKRLKTVAVRNNGALIRAYAFAYTYSPDTKRSLLASFKQHGSDATISGAGAISGGTSLPTDSFTYWDMTSRRMGTMISDLVTATTATETSSNSNSTEPELTYLPENGDMVYFGDFNGNNSPDFANTQDLGSAHSGVCDIDFYLNPEGSETPVDAAWFFGSCPWEAHAIIGDFNGDGNSDLSAAKRWSSSFPKEPLRSQFAQQGYGTGDHFLATAYLDGAAIIETSVVPLGAPGATNPNTHDNEAYPNLVAD